MARLPGHRQPKGTATDNIEPNATAPHLDSTQPRRSTEKRRDDWYQQDPPFDVTAETFLETG
jgi:hypothetical protein